MKFYLIAAAFAVALAGCSSPESASASTSKPAQTDSEKTIALTDDVPEQNVDVTIEPKDAEEQAKPGETEPAQAPKPTETDKAPAKTDTNAAKPTDKNSAPAKPEKPAPKPANAAAYVGKYKVDASKEIAAVDKALADAKKKADGGDEKAKQQLQMIQMQKTMMESFLSNMSMELRADKTWTLDMGEMGEMSGTYTADGNKLTLTATDTGKMTNSPVEVDKQQPQVMVYDPAQKTLALASDGPAGPMPKFKKI